ncbi:hypothetical protein AVEN_49236-1 [Araneus ventricosus]|uniref:Uncharacterized protein n=1 Tax=Araneus ventricosus TaxID=182803 RepID=A0A4Y2Q210_ARAVE|nr:hypothetical protein AVEN_49236-1 [Araneus ventricosus]
MRELFPIRELSAHKSSTLKLIKKSRQRLSLIITRVVNFLLSRFSLVDTVPTTGDRDLRYKVDAMDPFSSHLDSLPPGQGGGPEKPLDLLIQGPLGKQTIRELISQ